MSDLESNTPDAVLKSPQKVPVTAFVMSKCPDAVFCERHLAGVLDQVGDIVDFKTQYIAKIDDSEPLGVKCLHGESECEGNIMQLCIRKYFPLHKDWFRFVLCQDKNFMAIPSVEQAKECAAEAGINLSLAHDCIHGDEGKELLKASIGVTNSKSVRYALISFEKDFAYKSLRSKSCSIFIANKQRCIRDGMRWYNCSEGYTVQNFVDSICNEYRLLPSKSKWSFVGSSRRKQRTKMNCPKDTQITFGEQPNDVGLD
ncbi:hypothetical protein HDU97_001826 [Phlyctochytrium planicorne]|nr:hypothetical protein HDU97_001826 [Phlyctochytrium planicorne]